MKPSTTRTGRKRKGSQAHQVGPAFALLLAAWWGFAAGLTEVAVLTLKKWQQALSNLGPDYLWMAPLALLVVFLLVGCFFLVTHRLWKRIDFLTAATFGCALLAFLNLSILIPRLHHLAAFVLAAGIATQVTVLTRKHRAGYLRLIRYSTPWMLGLVLVLGAGTRVGRFLSERQALAALPPAAAEAPNVLLITLDTVRAPSLSLYGYERATTPNLEALARTGLAFDRALSTASWTLPSHASMFTGRWHHELSTDFTVPLDDTYPTLAEFLGARGYATAGFIANYGYCGAETGLARGFAHYEDYVVTLGQLVSSSTLLRTVADNFRLRRLLQNDEHLNRKTADDLNAAVLAWLDRDRTRPFFAFVNYFDAHEPYLPPAPFDTQFGPGRTYGKHSPLHHWLYNPAVGHAPMTGSLIQEEVDAYDGTLAYLDDRLGALFEALQERGLWQNTLLIITSDHGEEFGEHGEGEHRLFEHSYSLYLPSVHVPLVVSFPGRVPAGGRIDVPISLRDLPATIVDLLDYEAASPFPGHSLARYWDTTTAPDSLPREPLLAELNAVRGQPDWFPISKGDMKSLVLGGMRYIRNGDGSEELYDHYEDPWEQNDLADSVAHRDTLARLRALLSETTDP